MYRILSALAALLMTTGTVAFATPAYAAHAEQGAACDKTAARR